MRAITFKTLSLASHVTLAGCGAAPQTQPRTNSLVSNVGASNIEFYDMSKGGSAGLVYPLLKVEQVLSKIDSLGGPQKQFETDQAFAARMSGLGSFTTCTGIFKSQVKFSAATGDAEFSYLLLGVSDWSDVKNNRSALEIYPSTMIGRKMTELGKSEGQNAYGAKAIVTTTQLDNLYVVMNPVPLARRYEYSTPKLVGHAKQGLLDDLVAGKKVEMCFEATPIQPYVRYTFGGKQPTIADPTATVATSRNVRIAVNRYYIKGEKPQSAYVDDLRFSAK